MDQSSVTELRKELSACADLAQALTDRLDQVTRKIAAEEDAQSAYQSSVRRLRDVVRAERDAS